jgi:short-subunit dehydrogenase
MTKPLNEQIVVITGASSGIGRETALELAEKGATVVVSARREEALDSLVDEISAQGGTALSIPVDVSLWEEVEALADSVKEKYGRIDTWVNNAGVLIVGEFEKTDLSEARRLFDVNFWGELHGMKAALAIMREQGYGTIINITSVTAKRAFPLMSVYSASKSALNGLIEGIRSEIKNDEIQVCAIMPATIDTPLYDHALTKEGLTPKAAPPIYPPSEVAKAIVECAVNPKRQMYAGKAGRFMSISNALMPGAIDKLMQKVGRVALLNKEEPKSSSDENNLEQPTQETPSTTGGERGSRTAIVEAVPRIALGLLALFAVRKVFRR